MADALENGEWQQLDEHEIGKIPLFKINNIRDYADLPCSELPELNDNPDFITNQDIISDLIKNGEVCYETNKAGLQDPSHYEFNVTDEYYGKINDYLSLDEPEEPALVEKNLPELNDNPDFITDQDVIKDLIKKGEVCYETNKPTLQEPSHYEFNVTDDYFKDINDYLSLDEAEEPASVEQYVNYLEELSYVLTPVPNFEAFKEWEICILNRWHSHNNESVVYNVGSKTFRGMPGRPLVSAFFPLLYNNSIYIIGNDNDDELKHLSYRFDLAKREWTPFGDCQRWNHTGCTHSNNMYILGGCSQEGYLQTVEKFDFCRSEWRKERNLLSKRQFSGVAVDDTCMYVCGGVGNGNDKLHSIERYDPRDSVAAAVVDMNTVRGGCSAAMLSNQIYISDELTGITEIYDKRSFKNVKTTQPESRSRNFLVNADNKLYQIQKRYIWEYNALDDIWQKRAKINYEAPIAIAYQKPS